jgi:hypothetical protein
LSIEGDGEASSSCLHKDLLVLENYCYLRKSPLERDIIEDSSIRLLNDMQRVFVGRGREILGSLAV